jgi:hypothetical protein
MRIEPQKRAHSTLLAAYRSRYFTDAGIIGFKEFVGEVFDQVKHLLRSKPERKFSSVKGIDGVYSMKRLA